MIKVCNEPQVSPYESFVQSMNDLLVSHDVLHGGVFEDSEWIFKSPYTTTNIAINFNMFDLPEVQFSSNIEASHEGNLISLTTKDLAKVLWLNLVGDSSGVGYHNASAIDVIALIFAFLNEYEIHRIEEDHLTDLYGFMLSQQIEEQGVTRRFSPPTHQALVQHTNLSKIGRVLRAYRVKEVLSSFSRGKEERALDEACRIQLGMTLSDYKKGGSFNYLGLDIGRHYIDHCGNIFEEHFQYAVSVRNVLSVIVEEVNEGIGAGSLDSVMPVVAHALLGGTLDGIHKNISGIWSKNKLDYIYNVAHVLFRKYYNEHADLASAFQLDTVNEIISDSGLPERYDGQEFVRSILFTLYIDGNIKSSSSIFSEYFSALRHDSEAPNVSFDSFLDICQKVVKSRRQELPDDYGQSRLLCHKHSERLGWYSEQIGVRLLKSCVTLVESCGSTLFVGLLGWRRSEYGFPLSKINVERNHDVLDSLYTPFRFQLNWVVPKTSGKTPIDREITLYAYLTAYLLDKLNLALGERPALYLAGETLEKGNRFFDSAPQVSRRIDTAWPDFVLHYSDFADIDTLNELSEKAEKCRLNKAEENILLQLQSRFDNGSEKSKNIIKIRGDLLSDLPKYLLCSNSTPITLRDKVVEYVNETLDSETTSLLDKVLPDDLKAKLKGTEKSLSSLDIMRLRSLILQDVAYPTPHALRHIWAEAVLRRYRGDVGKFIRANFKHLDESFFMSYLRDKETRAVYEVAKRTVINGIVRQQIMELTNNGRSFAGGFDRFLSRAVKNTKVVSPKEYERLGNKISQERVVDIKSNAWVTCMLRVGTEKTARCSENGVPQRHNAEPKLCLGCVNGNISEGNFNGIVVYIKTDIEACRNPNLPSFIKELHTPVVKQALKRVRQLARNSQKNKYLSFITYLEETLELAVCCTPVKSEEEVVA